MLVFPLVALSGIEDTTGPLQIIVAGVGVLGAMLCVLAIARAGRLQMRFDNHGVEFSGVFRTMNVPWSGVEWVGWLMLPATAHSSTSYSLAVDVRGRRVPYCLLWVSSARLAQVNGVPDRMLKQELELALADRRVAYRHRVPDVSPVALWFWFFGVMLSFPLLVLLTLHLSDS